MREWSGVLRPVYWILGLILFFFGIGTFFYGVILNSEYQQFVDAKAAGLTDQALPRPLGSLDYPSLILLFLIYGLITASTGLFVMYSLSGRDKR
jgi:hypothetical protein